MDRRSVLMGMGAMAASSPALAGPSATDFTTWPLGRSPIEIGKRVADRFTTTPTSNFGRSGRPTSITYPEACTWYGALTLAQLSGDTALTQKLVDRFQPLFGPDADLIPHADHVDPSAFGIVPFELYIETRDPRYLAIGKTIADRQWSPPTPERLASLKPEDRAIVEQAVKDGLSQQTRFWIDDMYMITALETQAFRATGDAVYLDRAAREMVAYLDKLQQPNGLFYHAPDVPFFWGRGNGWVAAGSAELLRSLPKNHPDRKTIMVGYRKMMTTLVAFQSEDGMWRQLIDRPESWPESSCTGMFVFALATGVKSGWLEPGIFGASARKGWLALTDLVDNAGDLSAICEGTNKTNDYQYYMNRKRNTGDLHGQCTVLWSASAFLR